MQILLQKSNVNHENLKRYIIKKIAFDLSNLSEPCYMPKIKKDTSEFFYYTGLTVKDINDFTNRYYKNIANAPWKIVKNIEANLLLFIMYYFLNTNDLAAYSSTMKYLSIRYYTNMMSRLFPKVCRPDAFKYSLEKIPRIHLFSREGSISNALVFISNEQEKKYTSSIKNANPIQCKDFLIIFRTRIAQSCKSFAETYYKGLEAGSLYKTQEEKFENEEGDEELKVSSLEKNIKFSEDIAKRICVYKQIDHSLLNKCQIDSKIQKSVAYVILTEFSNIKYLDQIKIIINLFIKKLIENKINPCSHSNFNDYIKSLMILRRTNELIYFKQQVLILLNKIIEEKNLNDFNIQYKFNLSLFIAYYIGYYVKNSIC